MCYSAMVKQSIKELALRFGVRIQPDLYDSYIDLFTRRLSGEKVLLNKEMEFQFTQNPALPQEKLIAGKATEWHLQQIEKAEQEIIIQQERLNAAMASLERKDTKKAREDKRISMSKIEKLTADIDKHRSTSLISEVDQRIFPHHYFSMLYLNEKRDLSIRPFRYLMRPHNKDETFDIKFNGCYNARLDNLENVPWWRDSLASRRGIMVVKKFYENVASSDYAKKFPLPAAVAQHKNLVICFEPQGGDYMLIPTLWDKWERDGNPALYSAALVTDEPLPEISDAGHDRTPIFLEESAAMDWLWSDGKLLKDLRPILNRRLLPKYSHNVVVA